MDIKTQLKQALVKELHLEDISPEEIEDSAPLFGDEGLGLDSLDAVEIVVLIERLFGVVIEEMEENKQAFASIDSLAAFIQEHRQ